MDEKPCDTSSDVNVGALNQTRVAENPRLSTKNKIGRLVKLVNSLNTDRVNSK